ncbi:MAG: methyltransferase domain-containing protein, partial [Desulfobacterales bacterium]
DLYSGTGTIAIHLSDQAEEIVGIEINKDSVADARNNCRINDITNCRFLEGDIKDCLSQLDRQPDVMIIDPPRSGMHKKVVEQILVMAPDRIVYVSCNPATLARDLALLKETYTVEQIQPVDMFPHTYHIEAVALLDRKRE